MSNLIRWSPLREFAAMQSLMNQMMEQTFGDSTEIGGRMLALDVIEENDRYTVHTALPGVSADNIHINLEDNYLTIEAEIPQKTTERDDNRVLVREMTYGKFSRRVRLPQAINSEGVVAEYADGVLTLTLPKAPEALPRSIPVRRIEAPKNGHNN